MGGGKGRFELRGKDAGLSAMCRFCSWAPGPSELSLTQRSPRKTGVAGVEGVGVVGSPGAGVGLGGD